MKQNWSRFPCHAVTVEVVQWEAILCLEYCCHLRVLLSVWVKCNPLSNVVIMTAGRFMFSKAHSVKLVQVVEEERLGKRFSSRLYAKIFIYIYSAWSEVKFNVILYHSFLLHFVCAYTKWMCNGWVMLCICQFTCFLFKVIWWISIQIWKVSVHLNLSINFDLSVVYHHLHHCHHHHHNYGTQNLSLARLKHSILKYCDMETGCLYNRWWRYSQSLKHNVLRMLCFNQTMAKVQ
jgi:hypothetical protein